MKSFSARPATLYPHNTTPALTDRVFASPGSEYRGTPFWAWNNRLDAAQLLRQIEVFRRMGYGGFHLHARTGLGTPYLGDEFMEHVRRCVDQARASGMLAWLYDEDRWPSGFGGGLVTADPRHRMKYILFTRTPYNGTRRPTPNHSHARVGRVENGVLLARYAVTLENGVLVRAERLAEGAKAPTGSREWLAYLETAEGVPWYGHNGYVDTLSPAAIERFVAVTHERYREVVGADFGSVVPAIFTDEPQHVFKEAFDTPHQLDDITVPATDDFFETFRATYGEDLLDRLPEVFWELPEGAPSTTRFRYHDHVTARFAAAYARTLGQWCGRHGLLLTGHMMEERTLFSQTRAVGDAMRSLAHFQLPGIDMLCDQEELTTAKQAQSVARQYGRPGVMSELYGVTGWTYDFVGHKAQGDWQAALGVTIRVPHLAWVSMAGEAKRDYPASIHYQSPWWEEYRLIEDHFARVNSVLTRGLPVVRIGVLHPIESYWLCYGPIAQTKAERERRETQFLELPRWLLGSLQDFDYLNEALLPDQKARVQRQRLRVGAMGYDVVVVPAMRTIRAGTLVLLESFVAAGGTVIFAGEVPTLVDAVPSRRPERLARRAIRCAWDRRELLGALEGCREVECTDTAGIRAEDLVYQLREDGKERHLFVCNRNRRRGLTGQRLRLRGTWRVYSRDTYTGRTTEIGAQWDRGITLVPVDFTAHGHLLLTLRRGPTPKKPPAHRIVWHDEAELADPVRVTLSEPNVLLLNQAEWRWNDGPWQPREETLRIHNRVRQACGLPPREGHVAQPWVEPAEAPLLGRVELRFRVRGGVNVDGAQLALEEPAAWRLAVNGIDVATTDEGWWVDEAIRRVRLPTLPAGDHELVLSRDFTHRTELEWCYLLGDFGVRVEGRHARLVEPVRSLTFGDWTRQGLPFYAGNVTYHLTCTSDAAKAGTRAVHFPRVSGPLLRAAINGGSREPVAFAPFRLELPALPTGRHALDVTVFGNRHNAFGPLHNIDRDLTWVGPDAWRSSGDHWAYEYQLQPMGLLVAPRSQRARREKIATEGESSARLAGESNSVPRKLPPGTRPKTRHPAAAASRLS